MIECLVNKKKYHCRNERKTIKTVPFLTKDLQWRTDIRPNPQRYVPAYNEISKRNASDDPCAKYKTKEKKIPQVPHRNVAPRAPNHYMKAYKLTDTRRYSPFHAPKQVKDLDIFCVMILIKAIQFYLFVFHARHQRRPLRSHTLTSCTCCV